MSTRKHDALFRFTPLQEQNIVELYVDDQLSIAKIATQHGVDRDTISRLLKRHGIEKRKLGEHLRKYPLNEHYFDNIDTEDKAYFLGLLYADGCNHYNDRKKKVTISLQEDDKDILSAFSRYLYGDNEFLQFIKARAGGKPQFCLTMHSQIISQKLYDLGCVAQKSLLLEWPKWLVDANLQRHFIRGYFDGDGSISKHQRGNGWDYHWSLVSTHMFCSAVSDIINSLLGVYVCDKITSIHSDNDITHTIYVRGNNQILKLMDWLYQDATIYLARKHQKYLELKEWIADVDSRLNGYGNRKRKNRHIQSPSEQYSGIT